MTRSSHATVVTLVFAISALGACGGTAQATATTSRAAAMQIVSGNTQSGIAGEELAQALVVRVQDSSGAPVDGQIVNFRVTAGGGAVFAGAALSDANGEARERWTLGPLAVLQRLEARAVDPGSGAAVVFASFEATAMAGPMSQVTIVGGDNQVGAAGTTLPVPLRVKVADKYGNGVAAAPVLFALTLGTGSVSPASALTDSQGNAATLWTVGPETVQNVEAQVSGLPAAVFSGGPVGGAAGH